MPSDTIKRPNYFTSQFLVAEDFLAEQVYHRDVRQHHHLALHGWGVLGEGFQVASTPDTERVVTISPGVALDPEGRTIVLAVERDDLSVLGGTDTDIYLSIRYNEVEDEVDRYTGPGGIDDYVRITETPLFEFTTEPPAQDSINILLARLSLDADGNIAAIDNTMRQYASAWIAPGAAIPGPLTINETLTVADALTIGDAFDGHLSAATIEAHQSIQSRGSLQVDAQLTVDGDVGIGTDTPAARLQVSGGAIMPSAGNSEDAGILFPRNLGGGTADQAWIRYYVRTGERTTLEIGNVNDSADHIALMPSGNVGIGTTDPERQLHINSIDPDIRLQHITTGTQWNISGKDKLYVARYDGEYHDYLVINGNGNVGVGTGNPSGQLTVVGAGGNGQSVTLDSREIKFRGDGTAHFSVFANRLNQRLTIEDTSAAAGPGNGGTVLMAIHENGNVGVGTSSPAARLQVSNGAIMPSAGNSEGAGILFPRDPGGGGSDRAWIRYYVRSGENTTFEMGTSNDSSDHIALIASGNVGVKTNAPRYTLDVRGSIGNNTTLHHSDIRWKKNVASLTGALDKVSRLRGVLFEWKKEEFEEMNFASGRHLGVIAQEVEHVLPEVVQADEDGYKTVAYANLTALLIEAVKELKAEHEALKSQHALAGAK